MRWIKKFEASGSSTSLKVRDELKEFCDINLAYLMDDDYHFMITRRDSLPYESEYHKRGYIIHFYKWQFDAKVDFKWDEISDHFIPFIHRLSNEYTPVECIIDYSVSKTDFSKKYIVPLQSLLNDDLPKIAETGLIHNILIIVEEE